MSRPIDPEGNASESDTAEPGLSLRLELFGGPLLWRNHESVRLAPLQSGLFAIVFADRSERMPRKAIQELLWASPDRRPVRHRLSQLIYQTNRILGERVFESQGEEIRIHRTRIRCDLDEFRELLEAESFGRACTMTERGFLAACGYRKTEAFADWVGEQRTYKRLELRRAAMAAWKDAEARHDWIRARRAAQVLLRMEPTGEELLRRLMWARVMSGQVREAEADYRSFARRAAPGGPWTPEPATTQLLRNVHALADEELNRQSAANQRAAAAAGKAPQFVGRLRESAQLGNALFGESPQDPWRTISVSGEAGIGKTRLVEELLRGARFRGYRILRARATLLEKEIALGPILESLTSPWMQPVLQSLDTPWRTIAQTLLPELRDPQEHAPPPTIATPFFESGTGGVEVPSHPICETLLHLFVAISRHQPTILRIDSVQWLDSASVGVLQFLRTRWNGGPFILLLTHIPEDLRPGCSATRFVQEIEYGAGHVVIRLRQLARDDAIALARSVSPSLSESQQRRIAEVAGGNPRFIVDLARSWPGSIQDPKNDEIPVPGAVRQLVARRLETLSGAPRRVLFALAVIGNRSVPLGLLRRVAEVGRKTCLDALDTLHDLGLAVWRPTGAGFRRPTFAAATYREIHPSRRRVLHARTARFLQARAPGGAALLEVARHYVRAEKRPNANECIAEAIAASATLSMPHRRELLEGARAMSTGASRIEVLLPLAKLYHDLRIFESALSSGEAALGDPGSLTAPDGIRLRCLIADARNRLGLDEDRMTLGEFIRLEEVAGALKPDSLWAELRDMKMQLLSRAGMRAALRAEVADLRKIEAGLPPEVRCRVLAALTLGAVHANPAEAIEWGGRAVEMAEAAGMHDVVAVARQRQGSALMNAGVLGTASGWAQLSELRTGIEEADQSGLLALMLLDLAEWYSIIGEYEVVGHTLAEISAITGEMDCPEIHARTTILRGGLAAARSNPEEARTALEAIRRLGTREEGVPPPPSGYAGVLAAIDGFLSLELGKYQDIDLIAAKHPLSPNLAEATLPSILFHVRILARTGDPRAAIELWFRPWRPTARRDRSSGSSWPWRWFVWPGECGSPGRSWPAKRTPAPTNSGSPDSPTNS